MQYTSKVLYCYPGMNQAVGDIKSASWRGLADISSKYTAHPEYYKTTAYFG